MPTLTQFQWPLLCLLIFSASTLCAQTDADIKALENGAEKEARLMTDIRQLTFEGKRAGEGYYSRDGSLMVFQSEREKDNPWYQIYLLDLETGDTERVSPGYGKTTCAWIHPDNNRVLYASTHLDPTSRQQQKDELEFRASGQTRRYSWDYDEHFELFAWHRDTGKQQQLTRARGYDAEGSYSPDGKLICFASNRSAYLEPLSESDQQRFDVDQSLFMDLYMMNADGSNVRRLTFARGYDGGPFFSHDGKKICWRRFSEDGLTAEVYSADIDGRNQKQLTRLKAMSWAPYFHPSGEYLIFTTNRHGFGNFELYLVDKDGLGDPVRVSFTDRFDGLPTFTPDGNTIAWTTNRTRDAKSQIYLAKWNHAEAMKQIRAARKSAKASTGEGLGNSNLAAATKASIEVEDLRKQVYLLASEKFGGRMTGSAGAKLASAHVRDAFKSYGLVPDGDGGGYFQNFQATLKGKDGVPDRKVNGRNVLARLVPTDPAAARRPAVVLGAHLDHLGTTGGAWSKAKGDAKNQMHLGADDNASGVAAVLEIAHWISDMQKRGKARLQRPIVFAAWSGEEVGVLGSSHFCRERARKGPLSEQIACYMNLDMVGRLEDKLILSGIGSSPDWTGEIERRNAPIGLSLSLVKDCNLPTDTQPFYLGGVPILSAFTGAHLDYHTPQDTPEKVDFEGLHRITRFMGLVTRGMAVRRQSPEFTEYKSDSKPKARQNLKPYLGTIPDYAEAEIPGLQLSGVATGGPAFEAGLRGGDIIVKLGRVEVTDIHTYVEAIDALRVGETVDVTVVRKGEKKTFKVTPGSRE